MEYWKIIAALITLVGFVFGAMKFKHYLQDRKEKKLKEMPVEAVSYHDVLNEYNNAPPLQRKEFKSSYKGVKVKWHIGFWRFGDKDKMGRSIGLMCFYDRSKLQYVYFKVDLKKFPIIQSVKEGDKYVVTGLVEKVESPTVYLKLIDIKKDNFFVV